jgi:hypothetical protein
MDKTQFVKIEDNNNRTKHIYMYTYQHNYRSVYIYIYIYKRLKWFVKQHQVHKTK